MSFSYYVDCFIICIIFFWYSLHNFIAQHSVKKEFIFFTPILPNLKKKKNPQTSKLELISANYWIWAAAEYILPFQSHLLPLDLCLICSCSRPEVHATHRNTKPFKEVLCDLTLYSIYLLWQIWLSKHRWLNKRVHPHIFQVMLEMGGEVGS